MGGTSTGTIADAATGRTITEMRDLLDIYLEDAEKQEISPTLKLQLLNTAQDKLVSLLNRYLLPELDMSSLANALGSSGEYDFSGLGVFHNNAFAVKLTDGEFCTKLTFDEYRAIDEEGIVIGTGNPICYVLGNYIYVYPFSGQTIDIYYQKAPTELSIDPEVNCELADSMADLVIGLACENFIDKTAMALRAYENAMMQIERLNRKSGSDSVKKGIQWGTFRDFPKQTGSSFNVLTYSG